MATLSQSDGLLVDRVQRGDSEAWRELIARFEGRLLAFVEGRVGRAGAGEDIVQETFLGFLISLPNYDRRRPLEGYLFSIAAHKLTDHLRREGRRPTLPLAGQASQHDERQPVARLRAVSSMARSGERRALEEQFLAAVLGEQIRRLRERENWENLACLELLFVRSWSNQSVAGRLNMTEQAVASVKFEFIARLKSLLREQKLPEDVFPELCDAKAD
jgi:RNA polymerase sigma-70 factor (ECF subfamily)